VTEILHPVSENIDENSPLAEAVHKIVMWQTLSLLVTREGEPMGIRRPSDLFAEVSNQTDGMNRREERFVGRRLLPSVIAVPESS